MAFPRIFRVLIPLIISGASASAHANDPEWRWRITSPSVNQDFPTKQAAASHILTLTAQDPRYGLMTVEEKLETINFNGETYKYTTPKVESIAGAWDYQNVTNGGPHFASESELIDYILTNGSQSDSRCSPKSLTPNEDWQLTNSNWRGWGGKDQMQTRHYDLRRYTYKENSGCVENVSTLNFRRQRSVSCPSGYSGEYPPPGCFSAISARVQGTLTYKSCPNHGNPCNAVTAKSPSW